MRTLFTCAVLFAGQLLVAQPVVQAVLNAASQGSRLAPGALASIYGNQLAADVRIASSLPLPFQLNGVTVTIGGVAAPLLYVSPNQINILIPFELPALAINQRYSEPLIVMAPSGTSAEYSITLTRSAPAIFTQNGAGTGNALAFDASLNPVTALGSSPIVLYATGLGLPIRLHCQQAEERIRNRSTERAIWFSFTSAISRRKCCSPGWHLVCQVFTN